MWGRRRRNEDQLLVEAREVLIGALETAAEAQRLVEEARGRFEQSMEQIRTLLGHGDGLPVDTVRAQLAEAVPLLESCDNARANYQEARNNWHHPGDAGFETLNHAVELFTAHSNGSVGLVENLDSLTASMHGLRDKLLSLRDKIAPIRERAHTALTAARSELTWAGPSAQGRFTLEAQLNATEDRLRALDAGRVEVDPNRKITDWYRDVETQIAQVRDRLLSPR